MEDASSGSEGSDADEEPEHLVQEHDALSALAGAPCSPHPRCSMLTPSQVLRAHSILCTLYSPHHPPIHPDLPMELQDEDDEFAKYSDDQLEALISEIESQCEFLKLVMIQVRKDSMGNPADPVLLDSDPVKLLLLYTLFRENVAGSGRFIGSPQENRIVDHLSVNFL